MGLMQKQCHYCPAQADTRDHIVPRVMVKALELNNNHWFFSFNVVPACLQCNQDKGDWRSGCGCEICLTAWHYYEVLKVHRDEPAPLHWSSSLDPRLLDGLRVNIADLIDPVALMRLLGEAPET